MRWHPLARGFLGVKSQRIASEIRDLTRFATFDVRAGRLLVRVLTTEDIPDQHLEEAPKPGHPCSGSCNSSSSAGRLGADYGPCPNLTRTPAAVTRPNEEKEPLSTRM